MKSTTETFHSSQPGGRLSDTTPISCFALVIQPLLAWPLLLAYVATKCVLILMQFDYILV